MFDVSELKKLPMIAVRYVYYHECAHLSVPTWNEIEANCVGLLNMRKNNDISRREETVLRRVHYALKYLPPQYGGTGKILWDATMRCAGPR